MSNDRLFEMARDRALIELDARIEELARRIGEIKSQMNVRGVLHSSMTALSIAEACSSAGEEQVAIVWETFHRVMTSGGVQLTDDLAAQLKREVNGFAAAILARMQATAQEAVAFMANHGMAGQINSAATKGAERARRRVESEIDLFVRNLEVRGEITSQGRHSTVINAYAPIMSIQTGANATAQITQALDGGNRDKLASALSDIAGALREIGDRITPPQREVLEVVEEARAEIARPQPNKSRLKGLLTAVRDSVGTLADLREAGHRVADAVQFISDLIA